MTHTESANNYAKRIASGELPACKWVKLACKRHLSDLERSKNAEFPFRYDAEKANRACFFAELMPHVKGKWCFFDYKKQQWNTITLEPWQKFVIANLFGWVKKTNGKRRFTKARCYIPRKNAKSTLASAIGLYMLVADGESGSEVYSGATSQKQAMEVFKTAWMMVKKFPALAEKYGITISGDKIPGPLLLEDGSKFEPVIGNPGDGASPHCAITDEYHEHATSALLDTMETGMGAREQPLSFVISTAGSNLAGPCIEDWRAVQKMLDGISGFVDETCFGIIWTLDDDDEWDSELALAKANPNWGISVNPEVILPALDVAKRDPRKQAAFKTKHLNLWVSAKNAFFNIDEWNKLADESLKPEDFKDYPCILAADFASKHDLVALMSLFLLPDKRYAAFGKYYLPESTVQLPENQHYRSWVRAGWITTTPGEITDLDYIVSDAEQAVKDFKVEEMPSDPNRAWGIFPIMQSKGIPVVEYRNTVLTMSEPMKELDALIRSGRIAHNGDPVLAWAISNVTAQMDKKDNVFPNKESPAQKIDPVVALIFAIGRAMTKPDSPPIKPGFAFW